MATCASTQKRSRVVVATHNNHKFNELRSTLAELPLKLVPLSDWNLNPVAETGWTFVENALLKARFACKHTRLPALADDSGLVVDLLNGEPGIHSSRYAGHHATDEDNNSLLLARIIDKRKSDDPVFARFVAILVYLEHELDPRPIIAEGCWSGTIVDAPRGTRGFGYDPLFLPVDSEQTAGELDPILKNQQSHRAHAANALSSLLLQQSKNFFATAAAPEVADCSSR